MEFTSFENGVVICGDCLEVMPTIAEKYVDMVLCDLPYGTTHNRWDVVLPFDALWTCYNKIIKDTAAVCLFADGMFMANLMKSNEKMWKYNLVWNKILSSGFLNANRQPLRSTEEIVVFYKKQPTYNPQKIKGEPNHSKGSLKEIKNNNYGKFNFVDNKEILGDMKHPTSLINIQKPHPSVTTHPTQKPVELMEWLIKTYTNEGDLVLDNCSGSGTTAIACINTNRKFICIEKEKKYYDISVERIKNI